MSADILRTRIDEAAFRELVAGRVAKLQTRHGAELAVETVLEDIGWDRMLAAISDAQLSLQTPIASPAALHRTELQERLTRGGLRGGLAYAYADALRLMPPEGRIAAVEGLLTDLYDIAGVRIDDHGRILVETAAR